MVSETSFSSTNKWYERPQLRYWFYAVWIVLTLAQATFTQLQDDEAYYWVYAQFLDWGYFDHPPMIALLVKVGTWLAPGALGVRLLMVALNAGTIYLCEKMAAPKRLWIFYAVCLSAAVMQLAGFWAVPDVPLMFFTALFFFWFGKFLGGQTWQNTLLLALAIACLFYSKYHSVLVVGFAVLSQIRILRQPKIYFAGVVALLLFLPHLWWQYRHDWITFVFQLFENKAHPYQVNFTLDYLGGQLLIAGPIAGVILLYSTIAYPSRTSLEKALRFTAIGIFIFFLLSSLRGQVEANWTAPALVPMLVLTSRYLETHGGWRKWLLRLLPLSLAVIFFARIVMIFDVLPAPAIVERFHAWQKWPQQMKERTEGLPVVFYNSYQRASMYWFHTGQPAYSLNTYDQRRSNYNYWPLEDSLLGKTVYQMDIHNIGRFSDSLQARVWQVGFEKDENFHAFAKVLLQPVQKRYVMDRTDLLNVKFSVAIPTHHFNYLKTHPQVNEPVRVVIYKKQEVVREIDLPTSLRELMEKKTADFRVFPDLPEGDYNFILAVGSEGNAFTHNSYKTYLDVK
ncbi:MAG: ArnT family glycosyltransferase [Flavisolibacter sp.]